MLKTDVIATIATRIAIIAAGFFTSILTARYLGPAGRGSYFFVITLAAVIAQFGNFGLQASNTYLVAQDQTLLGKLVANSFWISLLAGIGISLVVLLAVKLSSPLNQEGLWFVLILVPATLFYMLGTNLLVGINRIRPYNLFQFGSNFLLIFGMLAIGELNLGAQGFIGISAISWLIAAVLLFWALWRLSSNYTWRFDYSAFRTGFRYATKAYITTLLGLLVLKGNVFLLKKYCSNDILGYFSIASQINDALAILPTSVALLLFPRLVRNSSDRWQTTRYNILMTGLFMLVSCVLAALLIKPFIHLAFGMRFDPAVPVLLWMLPGAFFSGVTSITSQYLCSIGYPRQLVYIWVVAFLLIILLGFILIPRFGANGAAGAFSITYALLFAMILTLAIKLKTRINNYATTVS